ncbi:MAG: septal ring lytic transglycosylase RlpA family protein [Deltaproteobacteria bacterium]|nr:septal ring lytic transglycosylase RlpA family protein [Deltaproteobacteria bacterium]
MQKNHPKQNLQNFRCRLNRSLPTAFLLLLAGMILLFSGCSTTPDKPVPGSDYETSPPLQKVELGFYQQGIASWYGHPFHGQATASGEIYDMHGLTAAHKQLPLGTKVLVTNLENQRQIEVIINDRGPFVKNRVIDLSKKGAQQLDVIRNGTAMVRLDIIELPESISISKEHPFAIQFGAFTSEEPALKLEQKIARKNRDVFIDKIQRSDGTLYRVRLGWFNTRDAAHQEARRLGFREAHIFRR